MTTIDQRTGASANDAYDSGDAFPGDSITDTTLYIGATAADETLYSGMMWASVNIPAGATINSASVTAYRIGFASDGSEVVTLYIELVASPSGYTAGSDSPLDRFGASSFDVGTAWSMGTDGGDLDPEALNIATPLAAASVVIGAITNLNVIAVGVGATSNAQMNAYSHDNGTGSNAPRLQVDYTAAAGGSAPVRRLLALTGVGR